LRSTGNFARLLLARPKETIIQTFITSYEGDHAYTASTLDNLRLNKQALEGWQILLTLLELDPTGNHRTPRGWVSHPAVKMWRDYELGLYEYIMAMVREWKKRGYRSTIGDKATQTIQVAFENALLPELQQDNRPPWLQDPIKAHAVASTHRTALLVKNYEHYSQFDWPENHNGQPMDYIYFWPTEELQEAKL
jgi:hypothetical protein